jgi:hypothetical protein
MPWRFEPLHPAFSLPCGLSDAADMADDLGREAAVLVTVSH